MSKKPTFSELRIYQDGTSVPIEFKLPYNEVHDFITKVLNEGYKFIASGDIINVIPAHRITKITATGIQYISKE